MDTDGGQIMSARAVIAEFFRPASGVARLHALTVVEDFGCSDGRVIRSKKTYDVEWSRRYGYYLFHHSGSGGGEIVDIRGIYHASGPAVLKEGPAEWCSGRDKPHGRETRLIRKRNRTRRLLRLPRHIDLRPGEDLFDWLESEGVEQDAVFCSECDDWVRGDYLCEHTWWCDKVGYYSTPTDPCGHDREECEA
jgi:hypothetical protein